MKTPREKDAYPIVEKWIKGHFHCFKTGIDKGLTYSRVDVVGVRDIGGDLSGDVETIAIEVKKSGSPFATTSGQTLGYNVYANRVYLAELREPPFSQEQKDIASHLGIGLIQIRNRKCIEIRSSPFYTPIRKLNLLLLDRLDLGRCQFCGCFFKTGDVKHQYSKLTREKVLNALEGEKGLIFWNYEVAERKDKLGVRPSRYVHERRFVCPDCVHNLLGVESNRIKRWFSDYAAESVRKLLAIQEKKIKTWFTGRQHEG